MFIEVVKIVPQCEDENSEMYKLMPTGKLGRIKTDYPCIGNGVYPENFRDLRELFYVMEFYNNPEFMKEMKMKNPYTKFRVIVRVYDSLDGDIVFQTDSAEEFVEFLYSS